MVRPIYGFLFLSAQPPQILLSDQFCPFFVFPFNRWLNHFVPFSAAPRHPSPACALGSGCSSDAPISVIPTVITNRANIVIARSACSFACMFTTNTSPACASLQIITFALNPSAAEDFSFGNSVVLCCLWCIGACTGLHKSGYRQFPAIRIEGAARKAHFTPRAPVRSRVFAVTTGAWLPVIGQDAPFTRRQRALRTTSFRYHCRPGCSRPDTAPGYIHGKPAALPVAGIHIPTGHTAVHNGQVDEDTEIVY